MDTKLKCTGQKYEYVIRLSIRYFITFTLYEKIPFFKFNKLIINMHMITLLHIKTHFILKGNFI